MQVVLQQNSVKVQQEGDLAAAEAEMGSGLCLMHWQGAFDRLEFKQHGLCVDDIGEVG